jgi:hypothetical protein
MRKPLNLTRTRDPLGFYMMGFLRNKTAAEARAEAQAQHDLAAQAGDTDATAFWTQVLAFLTATGH